MPEDAEHRSWTISRKTSENARENASNLFWNRKCKRSTDSTTVCDTEFHVFANLDIYLLATRLQFISRILQFDLRYFLSLTPVQPSLTFDRFFSSSLSQSSLKQANKRKKKQSRLNYVNVYEDKLSFTVDGKKTHINNPLETGGCVCIPIFSCVLFCFIRMLLK